MKLEIDRLSAANTLHEQLFASLKDEALNFLTSSTGLIRLIDRASSDSCTMEEAAKLVHNEPLLAAKMVAMANSAAYGRGDRTITSVKDALGLLGLGMLKTVAGAVLVSQLTQQAAKPNQATVSRLWVHSIEVAALSAVIASRFAVASAETALFAGIVHEIAGFYVLSKASGLVDVTGGDVVAAVQRDAASQESASNSALAVGTRRLLAALKIPAEVSDGIEAQWRGYLILPPESLGDTLMVANLVAATPSPFDARGADAQASGLDLEDILNKTQVAAVLKTAYDQVRLIQQAFNQRTG